MAVIREPNFTFPKSWEKCCREKCLLGRNVAPDIFDQKSREKSKSGRKVAGRNVAGRNVSQGEMSFNLFKWHQFLFYSFSELFELSSLISRKIKEAFINNLTNIPHFVIRIFDVGSHVTHKCWSKGSIRSIDSIIVRWPFECIVTSKRYSYRFVPFFCSWSYIWIVMLEFISWQRNLTCRCPRNWITWISI